MKSQNVIFKMDDLQFYVLFHSISVISRQWLGDNERLFETEPCLELEKLPPRKGPNARRLDQ